MSTFMDNSFQISLIVTYSDEILYEIMNFQGTAKSFEFGLPLKRLYVVFDMDNHENRNRGILVMNSATVHKINCVVKLFA